MAKKRGKGRKNRVIDPEIIAVMQDSIQQILSVCNSVGAKCGNIKVCIKGHCERLNPSPLLKTAVGQSAIPQVPQS